MRKILVSSVVAALFVASLLVPAFAATSNYNYGKSKSRANVTRKHPGSKAIMHSRTKQLSSGKMTTHKRYSRTAGTAKGPGVKYGVKHQKPLKHKKAYTMHKRAGVGAGAVHKKKPVTKTKTYKPMSSQKKY